jgi:hypothetical protein
MLALTKERRRMYNPVIRNLVTGTWHTERPDGCAAAQEGASWFGYR